MCVCFYYVFLFTFIFSFIVFVFVCLLYGKAFGWVRAMRYSAGGPRFKSDSRTEKCGISVGFDTQDLSSQLASVVSEENKRSYR